MAYVDLDDLRGPDGYLDQQFTTTDGEADDSRDDALTKVLARAEAFVNNYIGVSTSLAAAASGDLVVYGSGTRRLLLPVYTAGSVTEVATLDGYTVPDYIEQDGYLITTDSTGIIAPDYPLYRSAYYNWTVSNSGLWQDGLPYTVTAAFGWPATDLATLAEATLQTAVQLWRYRDAGGSETIGAEGAITTVRAGWTPLVKQALDDIKRRRSGSVGVW